MTSLFCLLLIACDGGQGDSGLKQLRYSGPTMGTQYHVSVVIDETTTPSDDIADEIAARLEAIERSMSTYIADSELSQLNRAQKDAWLPISDKLKQVLALAQEVSRASEGAFDITVGPLVDLWGFGPTQRSGDQAPSTPDIEKLLGEIGYNKILLQSEPSALKKLGNISLDLSAIAKGFAADDVSNMLLSLGYANHMVEIGGEVMVHGHNVRGQNWRIGIESPTMLHTGVQQTISISGVGVATSGDYRNYFEVNGRRYSHTIDPTTGRPITHNLASVTVIAPTAAEADAYATAINVLGFEAGKALAEKQKLAVYFIVRRGDSFTTDMTTHFTPYLSQG